MKADRAVWKAVEQEIASRITDHQFETWFQSVRFSFSSPESVSVSVPNRFHKSFLTNRYLSVIVESIETVTDLQQPRIVFQVENEDPRAFLASNVPAAQPIGTGVGSAQDRLRTPAPGAARLQALPATP